MFSIIFFKAKAKFWLSLRNNGNKRNPYIDKTQIFKFEDLDDINSDQFRLESVTKDFRKDRMREFAFNGNLYNLSIYSLTYTKNIFNIQRQTNQKFWPKIETPRF